VRNLACLAFLFCSFCAKAQPHTISGYVRDAASEENLIGATVIDLISGKGATANTYGFYSLTLTGDSARLAYSYVGYQAARISILLKSDTVLISKLTGLTVLDEVTINAARVEEVHETSRMGTVSIPVTQIKRVPAFMGETDVIKVIQLLPGVHGGNEGSGGLYVRGGGPDQNLILLDGVPIYNPTHLYGFFSTFNADVINHVELVKGGFPARYGGRLSSVVDISMKEGDQHKFHGQASVGLIAAKFALEGPLIKGRTSFIVSARHSYLRLLNEMISAAIPHEPSNDYRFFDLNAKVNHRINTNNRIFFSAYSGEDNGVNKSTYSYLDTTANVHHESTSKAVIKWGNTIASLRWNHTFGKRLFSNLSLNYSAYHLGQDINTSYTGREMSTGDVDTTYLFHQYRSGIRDYIAKVDFDFIPNPIHSIRFGGYFINHEFSPGAIAIESSEETSNREVSTSRIPANELGAYVEDDIVVLDQLKINLGFHVSAFHQGDTTYYSFQPRLSVRYALPNQTALKGSYSIMQQYVHLLSNAGLGLPTDLWVPATATVPAQKSWQLAFGAAKTIRGEYELSVEGFYKRMDNAIEYKDGASYMDVEVDWQDKVEKGQGRSYGAEFFIQRKVGQWSGWVGYTLSWTERQFANINEGKWFPYRYDRRHDFKVTSSYYLGKHWDFSGTWVFATGNAVTVPVLAYDGGNQEVWYYPGRNNFRMRNYHRLDLSVSYRITRSSMDHVFSVGVYNAYSRLNPFYLRLAGTEKGMALKQESLFPLLPIFSYSIKI
jgi:outer membrane cobalamin receptor